MAINGSLPEIWALPTFATPGVRQVDNTTVDPTISTTIQNIPYNFVEGVPGATTQVTDGAQALFPITNGAPESTLPGANGAPSDLGAAGATQPADLLPTTFENWTSEQQSEYLNYWISSYQSLYGSLSTYNSAAGTSWTSWAQAVGQIGVNSSASASAITAILSQSSPGQVYILNTLQKTDFGSMSLADQQAVAGMPYFQSTLATQLGLSSDVQGASNGISAAIASLSTTTVTTINSDGTETVTIYTVQSDGSVTSNSTTQTAPSGSVAGQVTTTIGVPSASGSASPYSPLVLNGAVSQMPASDVQVFVQELQLLQKQVNMQGVVSQTDIATQVEAIMQRFQRAAAFYAQTDNGAAGTPPGQVKETGLFGQPAYLSYNVVSEDNNASIASDYTTFMQQERQILAVNEDAFNVASSGMISITSNGQTIEKTADAPTLMLYFQMDADLAQESEITANTTEEEAINSLLQTYTDMQNLVSNTLKAFTSTNDTTTPGQGLANKDAVSQLTPQETTLLEMFDSTLSNGAQNPLEALFQINRPTQAMVNLGNFGLNGITENQWNDFATELSNAVTSLQQQSQILSDQINEETKEKDDHFNLANDAISKMYDIIQQVARSVS